ncbi:DNA methyltransferase, partial [Caballeronia sp. ATUFL_F2_KS42]|uniref:DNA methyltransferase n=1 Tax=Caballeronia sp. ATUFL_F2_KS42 TaxID=2921765 RepID=UPI0032ED302B
MRERRPSPSEDFGHPTCKPVELMKKLIWSVQDGSGGKVIDPFMGSGSTGVACQQLGLPC